jgi:hypothetical protein
MTDEGVMDAGPQEPPKAMKGPLVFISHDTRDAALAEALSRLLASVSTGMLKTFRSSDRAGRQGIQYGVEWYPELMRHLDTACDVVCLLTERSIDRPWLLYEAGVAKGKLSIPVHGLALGIPLSKASSGPFAQFQNCDDDVESMIKLVDQLVRRLPDAEPDREMVRAQVELFSQRVGEILESQPTGAEAEAESLDEASTAKLFEEIKVMFQDLPSRIETAAERGSQPSARIAKRSTHPGMLTDMAHHITRGTPDAGLVALLVACEFRDDLPWLYELGIQAYRSSLTRNAASRRRAFAMFARGAEMAADGPINYELRRRDLQVLVSELPFLLRHLESEQRGQLADARS